MTEPEDHIPIVQISDENFFQFWPALSKAIKEASFIALDCELSGLGNRSKLNCSEIDLRYQNIKDIAQDYAIVSLGISCFLCQSTSSVNINSEGSSQSVKTHNYVVQTFNVLTFCSTRYVVEYNSIKFLLSHGFDFNKQYSHGLPYTRGEDKQTRRRDGLAVRDLFHLMIRHRKPIVLHNGLVDIIFLYQAFYADLPRNVETFAADVLEMFPAGVYDTKYISEFHQSFPATFLEYLFKKLQLQNDARMKRGAWHCRIKFPPYPRESVKWLSWHNYLQIFDRQHAQAKGDRQPLCGSYKYHGWCPKASVCPLSHNVDRMVWELLPPKGRKQRVCSGIAYSSVAQLISFKKRKMEKEEEEEGKKGTAGGSPSFFGTLRLDGTGHRAEFSRGRDANGARGSPDPGGDARDSNSDPRDKINGRESGDNANDVTTQCEENGHSAGDKGRTDDSNTLTCSNRLIAIVNNDTSDDSKNIVIDSSVNNGGSSDDRCLPLLTIEDGETGTPSRQRDCNGHSAGFDAFMTGFIFACDIAMLGQLPTVCAFQNPKAMNLDHIAGKVYLIGKEFPFLVRSSAYGATSPTHDRIIRAIRVPQKRRFER